jgi:hypothetical protein
VVVVEVEEEEGSMAVTIIAADCFS